MALSTAFGACCAKIERKTDEASKRVADAHRMDFYELNRDPTREAYFCHSGNYGPTSLRTILGSWSQVKLVLLGGGFYAFQLFVYTVMANLLVYMTFHDIPPNSPSYPRNVSPNGTIRVRGELFDVGFYVTPDWGHERPVWLKASFIDLNVGLAQMAPPVVLMLLGRTKRFVNYVGTIGFVNLCKGIIQMTTVLPPANDGNFCWTLNFPPEELDVINNASFSSWFFLPWGATHGCNDMLWSGHTAQSCIGFLFINKTVRAMQVPLYLRLGIVVYLMIYVWAVLVCRMHYTIDVFVAMLVGALAYTHSPFRYTMWRFANILVRNTEGRRWRGSVFCESGNTMVSPSFIVSASSSTEGIQLNSQGSP